MTETPSTLTEFLQQNWTEQLPVINGILFADGTLLEWETDCLDADADWLPVQRTILAEPDDLKWWVTTKLSPITWAMSGYRLMKLDSEMGNFVVSTTSGKINWILHFSLFHANEFEVIHNMLHYRDTWLTNQKLVIPPDKITLSHDFQEMKIPIRFKLNPKLIEQETEKSSRYPLAAPLPKQSTHNLLLDCCRDIPFYTDMGRMMSILGWDACRDYDWLITDIEGGWEAALPDPCQLTGAQLEQILRHHPNEQYIWGVFSAFAPDTAALQIDSHPLPSTESPDFWQDHAKPQHPQALFEIVCWDSTYTLFIGLPDKLARRLVAAFPDCRRLKKL
mgnify:FL=1